MIAISNYFRVIVLCLCIGTFLMAFPQKNTYFIVKKNTHTTIVSNSNVLVKGNLEIEENIIGEGALILMGNIKAYVDADGNNINNLKINNTSEINLISDLTIGIELQINTGIFQLNNFDIYLNPFAKITEKGGEVIFNGIGKIIQYYLQPITHASSPQNQFKDTPFTIDFHSEPQQQNSVSAIIYSEKKKIDNFISPPNPPPKQVSC